MHQKIIAPVGETWPNGKCGRIKPHTLPLNYQSTRDTILSNFYFLHHPPNLHCLKNQGWAFSQQLWTFSPILYASRSEYGLWGPSGTNSENLVNNFLFFGWDLRIFLYSQSYMQVFMCFEWMHTLASACPRKVRMTLKDYTEQILKVQWTSDFI